MAAPQLFPIFPNDIGYRIMYELPLTDLLTAYLVSRAWRAFLNNDIQIREKMFRLPKNLEGAISQARTVYVQGLWQKVYDKMRPNETSPQIYWSHIRSNPLVRAHHPQRHVESESVGNAYIFGLTWHRPYPGQSVSEYDPPNYGRLTPDEREVIAALVNTMWVTYPPICRMQRLLEPNVRGRTPTLWAPQAPPLPPTIEQIFIEIEGHTVQSAFDIMSEDQAIPGYDYQYTILWPEKLWQLTHEQDSESEDN
jgi:hypothetical protein